jgi:hypothetical protein
MLNFFQKSNNNGHVLVHFEKFYSYNIEVISSSIKDDFHADKYVF